MEDIQSISEVAEAHRDELAGVPGSERRAQILLTWRQMIDKEAHDYADLVNSHKEREQIMQAEVDAIMQA